jgi:hypothetical protein
MLSYYIEPEKWEIEEGDAIGYYVEPEKWEIEEGEANKPIPTAESMSRDMKEAASWKT